MWFIQPKQDYIAQIPWEHVDEPAVMSWQIRARNYDTPAANALFVVFALISLGGGYFMALVDESLLVSVLIGGGMFILFILIAMSMTHQTAILVYRFTETHAEECSWKPQMDAVKPFLKWSAIILMPIVVVLIIMDPSLIITSLGPLAMGFAAWMMGSSKGYQEIARGSRHDELDWRKTDKIYLYPGRDIIGLNIPWYHPELDEVIPEGIREIYCREGERENVLSFFKSRLPEVEIVEEKFHL
ncbi:hypothetical protein [Halomonas sp. HL-93]|uniref:hypothetical protein n=1 Tax=Halomonas sp. HL-93 TaxID=1666906 RepID=UPI0007F088A6|nr:hypothetical protein [Halomonas sp. HL-93]SBR51651.1 hypothetical protein GA0071314_3296 [Halomonas sp. HL-93]